MAVEKSFKRAVLFGVLGALIFLVVAALLCGFFPKLKSFPLFKTQLLKFDLVIIAVHFRINLFVVIGFIAGWAFCLFKGSRNLGKGRNEQ